MPPTPTKGTQPMPQKMCTLSWNVDECEPLPHAETDDEAPGGQQRGPARPRHHQRTHD